MVALGVPTPVGGGENVEVRQNMNNEKLTSDRVPTGGPKFKKKSSQENWLGSEEIYAVKPAVPSKHKKTEHKEMMRVDDDETHRNLGYHQKLYR